MNRHIDLVVAALAYKLYKIDAEVLRDALSTQATAPVRPFEQYLVEQGLLQPAQAELAAQMAREAVRTCGNNSFLALTSLLPQAELDALLGEHMPSEMRPDIQTAVMAIGSIDSGHENIVPLLDESEGRYTFVSDHGKGGMGRVLIVHDTNTDREVALKELVPPSENVESGHESPVRHLTQMAGRFLQEGRITAQLEHPSIVPVYEIGRRRNGTLYYTMKLVRGRTLSSAMKQAGAMAKRLQLLSHFIDLCQAIAYAHSRGVIHRDIKPSNIMIGEFGETVVLDWGVAKVLNQPDMFEGDIRDTPRILSSGRDSWQATSYGSAIGTPHYMAPEQAEGKADEISLRSDVYSLGVVLYELLSGTLPFDGTDPFQVLSDVIAEVPEPVQVRAPDAPPELASICNKAMARDPKDRYASARELASEIQRFMTGAVVEAYSYTTGEMIRRYYKRHKPLVQTIAAAAAALLILGTVSFINIYSARNAERQHRIAAERAEQLAEERRAEAETERTAAETARAAETEAREAAERQTYISKLHLAQQHLDDHNYLLARDELWSTPEGQRRMEWNILLNELYPDLFMVHAKANMIFGAKFSPDGQKLFLSCTPEPPKFYFADTGELSMEADRSTGPPTDLGWRPDGAQAYITDAKGLLYLYDTETGSVQHEIFAHPGQITNAVYTPDSKHVITSGYDGNVRFWDASTGTMARELPGAPMIGFISMSPNGGLLAVMQPDNTTKVFYLDQLTEAYSVSGGMPLFSPDSGLLATENNPNALTLYSTRDGAITTTLKGHTDSINSFHFSADGSRLITASSDHTARVWDPASGTVLRTFYHDIVIQNAFIMTDDLAVILDNENVFHVHNIHTGAVLDRHKMQGLFAHHWDLSPDGAKLAAASAQTTLQVWDLLNPPNRDIVAVGVPYTIPLSTNADATEILSGAAKSTLLISSKSAPLAVEAYSTPYRDNRSHIGALSQTGRKLLSVLDNFILMVWDRDTGVVQTVFQEHVGPVRAATFSPDGSRVASGGWDNTVKIWDAKTGAIYLDFIAHDDTVEAIAYNPDGTKLATGGADNKVRLWDVTTGTLLREFTGHKQLVRQVAFNAAGSRLISGSNDHSISVWETDGELAIATLDELNFHVEYANYVADDYIMGSSHSKLVLWDVASFDSLLNFGDTQFAEISDNGYLISANGVSSVTFVNMAAPAISRTSSSNKQISRKEFESARSQRGRGALALARNYRTSVAVPAEEMWTRLERISESIEEGTALHVAKLQASTRSSLQLPEKGAIVRFDETPVTSRAELALAIADSRAAAEEGQPVHLEIQSDFANYAYVFTPVSKKHVQRDLQLSRDDAVRLLEWQRARTRTGYQNLAQPEQFGRYGLLLEEGVGIDKTEMLRQGIGRDYSVTMMNGEPFSSPETAHELLTSALDNLYAQGVGFSFEQTVRAGEFLDISLSVTVTENMAARKYEPQL